MTMLVDGGPSGPFFDDQLHLRLKDKLQCYKELDWPHKTVRRTTLFIWSSHRYGFRGNRRRERLHISSDMPGLFVPELGHHLFPAPQVAKIGLVSSIDSRPRLDQGQDALPLLLYSS